MNPRPPGDHARLPRLAAEWYRGNAWVHWSMTLHHRATGWLDALHHARLREVLVHALARCGVVCPAYCFMPDHAHFLGAGTGERSDQRLAARLVRTAWQAELEPGGRTLQRQGHDHDLREKEREHGALVAAATYVWENPERAGLVGAWQEYSFSGAVVPGYPDLDRRRDDFWDVFWRIYAAKGGENFAISATGGAGSLAAEGDTRG